VVPGETVGIVGPSGSGKSTLASLITGFHRPTAGRLLLDGGDIAGIDLRTFRRHLAVVSQQTILFHGTLRENIVYGAPAVGDAQLAAALAAANLTEFIAQLPQGVETLIGPAGVQLSGGQRQRVAIARALLREPKVLILDEATSALDAASEGVVQLALERLAAGRTTFVIAHRLAVVRRVDRVVVLEHGRVVEIGRPADLLARPASRFARMHAGAGEGAA
jgi:ATP-binding cassette subfamily B protein